MPVRPQSEVQREHVRGVHQHDDTRVRAIAIGIVVLMVTLGVVQLGMLALVDAFADGRPLKLFARGSVRDPSVMHWAEPGSDLTRLREEESAILTGAGWVDRERGIARIPLEAAIELTMESGRLPFPARTSELNGQSVLEGGRDANP